MALGREKKSWEKEVAAILNAAVEKIRSDSRVLWESEGLEFDDPVADCRVVEEEGKVTLTYDGAGYDHFSYQSNYSNLFRKALSRRLKEAGLHFEDLNNYSLAVYRP